MTVIGGMESEDQRALALVCSLKRSPEPSSSEKLANEVLGELEKLSVAGESIRIADHFVRSGVSRFVGTGDAWPQILERILVADIVILSTPTWLGHMSSVAQGVLERLDAELSERQANGSPSLFGKVAAVAVVGNEDGAHKVVADALQGLNDVGFSAPAQASTYWNGEAMNRTDYLELDQTPSAVAACNLTVAVNCAHLARILRAQPFPNSES